MRMSRSHPQACGKCNFTNRCVIFSFAQCSNILSKINCAVECCLKCCQSFLICEDVGTGRAPHIAQYYTVVIRVLDVVLRGIAGIATCFIVLYYCIIHCILIVLLYVLFYCIMPHI